MNRTEVLDKAKGCVCGDRDHDYGGPEKSFECIAMMWDAYLTYRKGRPCYLEPADVAAMMALMKIARIAKSPEKADSWIDLAGYAACGGECACGGDDIKCTCTEEHMEMVDGLDDFCCSPACPDCDSCPIHGWELLGCNTGSWDELRGHPTEEDALNVKKAYALMQAWKAEKAKHDRPV